jgi:hypothetical protein
MNHMAVNIERLKDWHDYEVYTPIYARDENGNAPCVGLPLVSLVKNDKIRWSTPSEAMKILATQPDYD